MNKRRLLSVLLDVFILFIILAWGYLLFREFSSFGEETTLSEYSLFNVKALLYGIFIIAGVTVAFYVNWFLREPKIQSGEDESRHALSEFTVPGTEEGVDFLSSLEELRKLLDSKLGMIDRVWESYVENSDLGRKESLDEEELLKALAAQSRVLSLKSVRELFDGIVGIASELTASSRVSLLLYNPESKKIRLSKCVGMDLEEEIEIAPGEGTAGYAFKNAKRLFVTNVENHPELGGKNKPQYNAKSFMVFPVKVFSGVVVGVLNLTEKEEGTKTYSLLDLEKMNLLINTFSLKIENMILSNEYSKIGNGKDELKKGILEFLKKV